LVNLLCHTSFGEIRTTEVNGEPWFCLADVCKPLGIQTKHCKERLKPDGVVLTDLVDSTGRANRMLIINEGNLYRAIFQSKKPEAEQFTDWVTEDVLPALRKKGAYTIPTRVPEVSLSGLANLIRITRRVMLDMGSTPQDVGHMMKDLFKTWNVPVPIALESQIPGQLYISDANKPLLET
jgi:prophage antirepressor-like protein